MPALAHAVPPLGSAMLSQWVPKAVVGQLHA
jgi:hypothetical protein